MRRIFLLLAMLLAACSQNDSEQVGEPVVRPVKMLTVSLGAERELFRFPAVISAGQYAEMSFQVGGLIDEVLVVESQEVSKGDTLVRLEQRGFQNRLTAALAQFESAVAEYDRAVRMAKEDAIASSVLEQRATQRDVAKTQLDNAEKAVQDSVLRAPFGGTVAKLTVRESQNVAVGQLVVQLINLDTMEVSIDMPETLVAVSLQYETLGAYVILDAEPNIRIPSTRKESTHIADPASQTYRITGTFVPPPDLLVLPGMNATVEIEAVRLSQSTKLTVPIAAIFSDGNEKYVWVVDNDTMVVSRREVTVADGIGEFAIITEGLEPSETLAIAGASYLTDGMQVRPWTD